MKAIIHLTNQMDFAKVVFMDDETRAFLRSAFGFLKSDYQALSQLQIEIAALRNALTQIGDERFAAVLHSAFVEATNLQAENEKIGLAGYDLLIEKLK